MPKSRIAAENQSTKRDLMRRSIIPIALLLLTSFTQAQEIDRGLRIVPEELGFERPKSGGPFMGWGGGPRVTIGRDTTVVHSGTAAAVIQRDAASPNRFTSISRSLPVDFAGDFVELKGWLKSDDVEGVISLWLREDGRSGSVQFKNMQNLKLDGTRPWTEYSITLPLDMAARELYFGALLSGTGTLWVDDLELLVDGKPVNEAPALERELSVLDTDTEFDAGSGIELSELTPVQAGHVALLGRIWGFLKYHHPRVAAGELHWDYELFRILPDVLAAADGEAARRTITAWVEQLGEPWPCDPCVQVSEDVHLLPDLDWLRDGALLGPDLSARLPEIYEKRFAGGESFYIAHNLNVGNPEFLNEIVGPRNAAHDSGYRILAVLRYWNMIEYWFPYRNLIDEPWADVLPEALSEVAAADSPAAYELAMLKLIARTDDTHANLRQAHEHRPPTGDGGWPVQFRMVEGRPTVWERNDPGTVLKIGDQVLAIDGVPVGDLFAGWEPFYCASNRITLERNMARSLSRGPVGPATATVRRGGETLTLDVPRVSDWQGDPLLHDRPGETFQLLSEQIAYVKLSSVKISEVASYIERAEGTCGLVIDIRNYPSEFMVYSLAPCLLDEPTEFARFTAGDRYNPGVFTWIPPLTLQPAASKYEGRVAVLVDETSVSSSEYTAMALRCGPRAVVVGSTTAGADGNVSRINLPGGLRTMISGIGVFYPDKTPTQRVGIVPDIEVRPTAEGIREGRDEVMEAAVRHLLGKGADEGAVRGMCQRVGR